MGCDPPAGSSSSRTTPNWARSCAGCSATKEEPATTGTPTIDEGEPLPAYPARVAGDVVEVGLVVVEQVPAVAPVVLDGAAVIVDLDRMRDFDRAAILETVRTGASGIGRGERVLRV